MSLGVAIALSPYVPQRNWIDLSVAERSSHRWNGDVSARGFSGCADDKLSEISTRIAGWFVSESVYKVTIFNNHILNKNKSKNSNTKCKMPRYPIQLTFVTQHSCAAILLHERFDRLSCGTVYHKS